MITLTERYTQVVTLGEEGGKSQAEELIRARRSIFPTGPPPASFDPLGTSPKLRWRQHQKATLRSWLQPPTKLASKINDTILGVLGYFLKLTESNITSLQPQDQQKYSALVTTTLIRRTQGNRVRQIETITPL